MKFKFFFPNITPHSSVFYFNMKLLLSAVCCF